MVTSKLPVALGVPDSAPSADSVMPVGSVPASSVNVYGAVPPRADRAWVYSTDCSAVGSVSGSTTITGAETASVYARTVVAAVPVVLSVAVTLKSKLPACVGVPASWPVETSNVRPAGRVPALRLYW